MNLCWFCRHPYLRNLDSEQVQEIDLRTVCEAHIDYEVFYLGDGKQMPVAMTPRLVLKFALEVQRLENLEAVKGN